MMSDRRYTLFLVSKPEVNEPWDFELLADRVRQCADEIAPIVVADRRDAIAVPDTTLPAMTFRELSFARADVSSAEVDARFAIAIFLDDDPVASPGVR